MLSHFDSDSGPRIVEQEHSNCSPVNDITPAARMHLPVVGKPLGKCSELSFQLLYIKWSTTTLKLPSDECSELSYSNMAKAVSYIHAIFLSHWTYFIPSQLYLSDQ